MADIQPTITAVKGFKVAGVHCGLKKDDKLDFALIVSETPCSAAGVFTTNQVKAAPVLVDQERLKHHAHHIRAVAINTGCANACTGQQGIDNALQTARWVAERIGCDENQVLVMSTGVIGTQLPMDKIKRGVDLAVDSLGDDWESAARAIMTTDTRPKLASWTNSGSVPYQIMGIAKGAGMIAPNMATLLSLIVTDAEIASYNLQALLNFCVDQSFNRIVVDGDMSTNDTVLVLANGASGAEINPVSDAKRPSQFQAHLLAISRMLARDIVSDGEGATKFITILVDGAPNNESARQIANCIATSPLVKTAFYGGDANWGRIVAAAGRAGVPLQLKRMRLWIAPGEAYFYDENGSHLLLFEYGLPAAYNEEQATDMVRHSSVTVLLDCGMGEGTATVYTCDLSHEYVSINADYRS